MGMVSISHGENSGPLNRHGRQLIDLTLYRKEYAAAEASHNVNGADDDKLGGKGSKSSLMMKNEL